MAVYLLVLFAYDTRAQSKGLFKGLKFSDKYVIKIQKKHKKSIRIAKSRKEEFLLFVFRNPANL